MRGERHFLILIIISLFFGAIFIHPLPAQEDCEECQNPIVELKNLKMGDFESAADEMNKMAKEFYGWDELLGKSDISAFDVLQRGISFISGLKKRNPCADIYYAVENIVDEIIRFGIKEGQAKYDIKSTLNLIKKASGGEKALVRHVVYQVTALDTPRIRYYKMDDTTTIELEEWYDVKEISNQLKLVPKIGTIEIMNELVALKNDEVYDTGDFQIDWVQEPKEDEAYFSAKGETLTVDGKTYRGSDDGLFCGNFSTGDIAGAPIIFDKGDIGITIRKKETPSRCILDIDHESKYPPLFEIKVKDIKNLFGEKMPNKVKVAFKAEKGEILNGEQIDGWRVFNSTEGKIRIPIMYKPPKCTETDTDFLKVAGVCDFHDGPVSIGKERFKRKIINPYCHDVTATITYTETNTRNFNESKGQPGSYYTTEQSNSREHIKCEIFLTCEKEPRLDYKLDKKSLKMKIRRYRYSVKSAKIQSASLEGQIKTNHRSSDATDVRQDINCNYLKTGVDFKMVPPSSRQVIEIRINPSTGLIDRVHLPSYKVTGTIHHETDCNGVKRKTVGVEEQLLPYELKETRDSTISLHIQPTIDAREDCWKVSDDKNTRYLRGDCSQSKKKKYVTEELRYEWEVKIRKKK